MKKVFLSQRFWGKITRNSSQRLILGNAVVSEGVYLWKFMHSDQMLHNSCCCSSQRSWHDIWHAFSQLISVYRSIQIDYRQTFPWGNNFQLQSQNRVARRINVHNRDGSVGISAEHLSLQIQILSWIPINFHHRYRFRAQNELTL